MSMQTHGKTQGQQFLEVLGAAKNDKEKMFTLLRSTLEKNNPLPSEKVNFSEIISRITDNESIASLNTTRAAVNAKHGAFMFAEDYIYLTAKAYKEQGLGNIKDFKRDFMVSTQEPKVMLHNHTNAHAM